MIAQQYFGSISSVLLLHWLLLLSLFYFASTSIDNYSLKENMRPDFLFNFPYQLESMDLNKNHMESSSKARSHRSLRTRHQHDHEWNSNEQECHMAYEERISHHCRYPGTTEPCYENAEETSTEQGLKRVKSMSKHCCQKTCSLEELEKLCCRTSDCLKKCYGNRLTEWEDIDKADSSLYRYFDVLVKPHPSRKYKGADKF